MQTGRLIKNPAVVCTTIDDGAVLLDLETTSYYSLNRTALGIWELIDDASTLDEIADRITARYDVDHEHAFASVQRLVTTLHHDKLIRMEP